MAAEKTLIRQASSPIGSCAIGQVRSVNSG